MWLRSIIGLLISLLLMTTLVLNVVVLLPLPRDVFFLFAFVGGIFIWGAILTYFYCARHFGRTLLYCLPILLMSASINTAFYMGVIE